MKLTFYGGAKSVTGANYLLQVGKTKVLIDCGLFQGPPELVDLNYEEFPYNPREISHVFVTHSHQDHCGRLPKLVRAGFRGEIVSTPPTQEMMAIALEDTAHLLALEAQDSGYPAIYDKHDVEKTVELMEGYRYNSTLTISPNMTVKILNAGHILGSAMYVFTLTEGKKKRVITFTGDLGNLPPLLITDTSKIDYTDYLVIESAYGNRNHESPIEKKELLKKTIMDTIWNKGTLLIPSFAIERTQILLYEINHLVEKRLIPRLPIFIDSPLAIKMTRVYQKYENYFNFKVTRIIKSGDDIFKFPGLKFTERQKDSLKIKNVPGPKIIIAGSGMSTGGRILEHEKMYLPDHHNYILFVGYQVAGSLGRKIFEGNPLVEIKGEHVRIRANVRAIGGYSAHADQRQLLNVVRGISSKVINVFVVQGERQASFALKEKIEHDLKIKATVPKFE